MSGLGGSLPGVVAGPGIINLVRVGRPERI